MNVSYFTVNLLRLSDQELIDRFNQEVGNSGWTAARGKFLLALRNQFSIRQLDYRLIGDFSGLSVARKIKLTSSRDLVFED